MVHQTSNKEPAGVRPRRRHIARRIVLISLGVIFVGLGAALGVYAYRNMHYDEGPLRQTLAAGFSEKQVTLANGTVLNYAEGPDNGPPLLLIHGQAMAWEDYSRVLPGLSMLYHVFAVDCHGHGESSHDPARYTCAAMGQDFVTFIRTVIKKPCVLSGLSSGGILTTWIAANAPDLALGLIIEDSPFFSVQPEEMQNTFVWKDGFQLGHDYLQQQSAVSYSVYYFQHSYLWGMFGGLQNIVAGSAGRYQAAHPGEPVKLWFVPYSMTYGTLYLNRYDVKFAESFYNGSWFDGTSQEQILSQVKCPSVYIKAKTKYGKDGVQWAANSDEDAEKVHRLLASSKMITLVSGHDIHFEKPGEFLKIFEDFAKQLQ